MYLLGLTVFFCIHLVPVLGLRPALVKRWGEGPYKGIFSLISACGLGLIIWGWASFPNVYFYEPPKVLKHVNILLMIPAVLLLVAAYVPSNIRRFVRNPMLTAIKIWALGHLLANGDLRSMLLFLSFLAFAVIDVISLKKRLAAQPKSPVSIGWDVVCVITGLGGHYFLMKYHGVLFGMPVTS